MDSNPQMLTSVSDFTVLGTFIVCVYQVTYENVEKWSLKFKNP
jgi:hypothetical protein